MATDSGAECNNGSRQWSRVYPRRVNARPTTVPRRVTPAVAACRIANDRGVEGDLVVNATHRVVQQGVVHVSDAQRCKHNGWDQKQGCRVWVRATRRAYSYHSIMSLSTVQSRIKWSVLYESKLHMTIWSSKGAAMEHSWPRKVMSQNRIGQARNCLSTHEMFHPPPSLHSPGP